MILPWNRKYEKEIDSLKWKLKCLEESNKNLIEKNDELLSQLRLNRINAVDELYGYVNIMGEIVEITCDHVTLQSVNLSNSILAISGEFSGIRSNP